MELNIFDISINVVILLITLGIGFKVGKNFDKETVIVEKEAPKPEPTIYTANAVEVPTNKPKSATEQAQEVFNKQFQDIVANFERDILTYMQRGEYSFNSFSVLYNRLPKEATFKALQQASKSFHKANPLLEVDATFTNHHAKGQYVSCTIKFKETS